MNSCGDKFLMGQPQGRYDGHCHVFRADLPMVQNRRYTPEYDALPEHLCQLLQAHELDGAVLVQPSFLGTNNRYLLDTLAELENHSALHFKGVVVLDPDSPPDIREIERISSLGVIGLRLNLYKSPATFDHSKWRTLLHLAESQDWHIELHCEAGRLPTVLPHLTGNYSNIVVDHFGLVTSVNHCEGLATILQQPPDKLWIKTSAPYRLKQQLNSEGSSVTESINTLHQLFTDFVGAERVVWGSDWPFTQFEDQITYSDVARNHTS